MMKAENKDDENLATVISIVLFFIFGFLAMIAVYVAETMSFVERSTFVVIACFFGWPSFFASPSTRLTVMSWLPLSW
jgi:uncharacterized membrane protein